MTTKKKTKAGKTCRRHAWHTHQAFPLVSEVVWGAISWHLALFGPTKHGKTAAEIKLDAPHSQVLEVLGLI